MKRLLLLAAVAVLALPAGAAGASGYTVDLATGRIDGHTILGRTVAGVTAALGRPDFHGGTRRTYMLGWGARPNFSIEVRFQPLGGVERAWSMAFERDVRDVKLGDLLVRSSPALQAAVVEGYADTFRLVRPYRCKNRICVGDFAQRNGSLRLTFGTEPLLGTWLTVYQAWGREPRTRARRARPSSPTRAAPRAHAPGRARPRVRAGVGPRRGSRR